MIKKLLITQSNQTSPYYNLAIEEYLLENVHASHCMLYLWQNQRTVVIGRNQNAYDECNIDAILNDGGYLARRPSGGGAVYHDLGNLNFTFIMHTKDFDKNKQTSIILNAMKQLGIHAERTGRNDLCIHDRKFSGHAYYHKAGHSYHHGTLMVSVDLERVNTYLNVSPLKLKSKGIKSVCARVINLKELDPNITLDHVKEALIAATKNEYGCTTEGNTVKYIDQMHLEDSTLTALFNKYKSNDWIFKKQHHLEESKEGRFNWGCARIDFTCKNGVITQANLWSDSMDAAVIETIPCLLEKVHYNASSIEKHLIENHIPQTIAKDLAKLITRFE